MTLGQVRDVAAALGSGPSACVSVFAGRVADTGRDPVPMMAAAVEMLSVYPQLELIWASPRELLNIFHADSIGCHIITVTHDLLKKLPAGRQGPRRVLAGHGQDVPQRRRQGGLPPRRLSRRARGAARLDPDST